VAMPILTDSLRTFNDAWWGSAPANGMAPPTVLLPVNWENLCMRAEVTPRSFVALLPSMLECRPEMLLPDISPKLM